MECTTPIQHRYDSVQSARSISSASKNESVLGKSNIAQKSHGAHEGHQIGSMTIDFELIERYAIFVSLCDTLRVLELV